jgi:citrate lyase beta subunit
MKVISPFALGATMYMPVIHDEALACITGEKYPNLRSMVLCLEDALLEKDIDQGMQRLQELLHTLLHDVKRGEEAPLLFVRPRDLDMARTIVKMRGLGQIDGFVAPKVKPGDVYQWITLLNGTNLRLMPTLETAEAFDLNAMKALCDEMLECAPERILAVRFGGNDLMSCLGVRRQRGLTLYDGPLHYVLSMLLSVFGTRGFALTSPVYDDIDDVHGLIRELDRDVHFGFVGKTAIHPSQIDIIHRAFSVPQAHVTASENILDKDAKAVFKFAGSMLEPATHTKWAERVKMRKDHYGITEEVFAIKEVPGLIIG